VSEDRSQLDKVLDALVYAPVGLAQSALEEFDKLAEKGRHRVEGQVHTARLVGQFALQMARRQTEQSIKAALAGFGRAEQPAREDPAEQEPPPVAVTERTGADEHSPAPTWDSNTSSTKANGSEPASDLAIPGYDSLSASQVVQRLGGLSRAELVDVKDHEQGHRHRRTILNRVDQLLSGADSGQP